MAKGVYPRPNIEDRFWSKVNRGDSDACWPFTGARYPPPLLPYGQFSIRGRQQRAHRVAWRLTRGAISAGMQVLHRCDNPPCCNPVHLYLGTHADNMRDRNERERTHKHPGELSAMSKLRDAQVREIRAVYRRGGIKQSDLGARYGIDQSTVSNIITGKRWSHIQGE